ncbi:MAG: hypothetical protein KJ792_04885 [Actinobacteria bacterium]|nr:hypothetical protein [Actinomycetota bacterium]MCG2801558.1 hypothetical protein [Cellulomonas sp.]
MSATTRSGRPSPTLLTTRLVLRRAVVYGGWFWLVVVVLVASATGRYGPDGFSFLGYGRQAVSWFLFSQAITLVAASLRVHVGSGMTRRSFVRGALAAHTIIGAAHGVVFVALLQLERLVHQAAGWPFVVHDGLDATGTRLGLLLLDFGGTIVVASLSGLLVGIVYQRVSAWWGTVALPFTVGPLLVVLAVSQAGPLVVHDPTPARLVAVVGSVVGAGVVAALAFALLSLRAPVRLPPV